jgi:hypothetical protein
MDKDELKQKFLEVASFDRMLEDVTVNSCEGNGLDVEEFTKVFDNVHNNYELEDLYFNTFLSFFGRKDRLEKYIELEFVAREAFESFFTRLADVLSDEINMYLPEHEKIEKAKRH